MRHVTEYSKQELNDMLKELTIQFQEAKMDLIMEEYQVYVAGHKIQNM